MRIKLFEGKQDEIATDVIITFIDCDLDSIRAKERQDSFKLSNIEMLIFDSCKNNQFSFDTAINRLKELQTKIICILLDNGLIMEYLEGKEYTLTTTIRKRNNMPLPIPAWENIEDALIWALTQILIDNLQALKCSNCGKLFFPSVRSDEVYCNRIVSGGKTCKDIGYENKIKSNEFMKAYRTAYKTKNAFKLRNSKNSPNINEWFNNWVIEAKTKLAEALAGKITLEEYKKWLKE